MRIIKFGLTGGADRIPLLIKHYRWSESFHSRAFGKFSLKEGKKGGFFYA
jgi:hypothetical protein